MSVGDACSELDITVGVEFPLNFQPNSVYYINMRMGPGVQSSSPYVL